MSGRIGRSKYVIAAVAAFLLVSLGGVAAATPPSSTQHILVPSYINPGSGWDGIASSSPTVGIALLNVDSGPGTGPDAAYQAQVATEEAAGISMYAYVWTDNGSEPLTTVEDEVNDYASWYGVKNIFFDGASTDCSMVSPYYQPLYDLVHDNGGNVIINPGTSTSACYMSAADIVNTFEGSYAQYLTYSSPSWTTDYPATDFSNIVYDTPTVSDMTNAVARSQAHNVGWVYVTNLGGANPYDALPNYWADEVDSVAGVPLTSLQVTSTSPLPDGSVRLAYSATLAATGGNPSYKWKLSSGSLPAGLKLKTDGVISGRPKASGTSTFTVEVTDHTHDTATQALSITVTQPSPTITMVKPNSGPDGGGNKVVISGTSLWGASSVTFGTSTATIRSVNEAGTKLTVEAPPGTTGPVDVTVITPGGTTTAADAYSFRRSSTTKISPRTG